MIPCFICGKDASTGWVKGYTPAPDSQKVALCAEHDTVDNRIAAARAWYMQLKSELGMMADAAHRKGEPLQQMATIHFTAGGMVSFPCTACEPTPHGTLCIEAPDGARTYVPMEHIHEYSVRPYKSSTDAPKPKTEPVVPNGKKNGKNQ